MSRQKKEALIKRLKFTTILFLAVASHSLLGQSNPIPGDPVTIQGKVGIGTTSPFTKLDVKADGISTTDAENIAFFYKDDVNETGLLIRSLGTNGSASGVTG